MRSCWLIAILVASLIPSLSRAEESWVNSSARAAAPISFCVLLAPIVTAVGIEYQMSRPVTALLTVATCGATAAVGHLTAQVLLPPVQDQSEIDALSTGPTAALEPR